MRSVLVLVLLGMLAAAAGGYVWHRSVPVVALVKPSRGPAVAAVYATGTVEPVMWSKLSPALAGRLTEVAAAEGATVAEGQVLARLDDREARARVVEAEARERYAQDEWTRQSGLIEHGVTSRQARDKARSEYLQTQANTAAIRQRLHDYEVVAPAAGTVLRRDGELGELVDKTQVLFWIGQPRPLRITADIDEEDIPRVQPGQKVLIKADAFPNRVLDGRIAEITPKGDPVNKSFRVRVALPDDTPLMIGMTTEINVVTAEIADALLLPAAAIAAGRVFVLDGEVVRARPVTLGVRGRDRVQILDGVLDGEVVVAEPPASLSDGARVRQAGG